jgi:hypothetical protein
MRKKLTIASAVSLAVLPVLMPAKDASAIPAFARKYGTSCYTCHSGFVTRNSFGEAFRNNGYRWPGGEDEDKAKQEQLKLGNDGFKKTFPNSVWPFDIPPYAPFAVWVRGNIFNYSSTQTNASGATIKQQTLNWGNSGAIQNTALFFGGTIGENLSILGEFDSLAGTPRGHFIWAFQPGLNLSFGNFFSDFSFGQAITTSNSVLPTDPAPNALGTGAELSYIQERFKIIGGLTQAGVTTTSTGVNAAT